MFILTRLVLNVLCAVGLTATTPARIFDLADAVGGGNGSLPGTGAATPPPSTPGRVFLSQPTDTHVDDIFVPLSRRSTARARILERSVLVRALEREELGESGDLVPFPVS